MAGEETTYSVTALTVEDAELVTSLAELLEEQWPGKEKPGQQSAIKRREKRLREQPKQGKQSFAFLSNSSKGSAVVGHFCLQKAVAAGGEPSCAVSSVVVRKSERGKGLGLRLMALAKEEALERGYRVMYLWTEDAKEFYRKSGFELCEKVNLFNAAVEKLDNNLLLEKLNASFAKKMDAKVATINTKKKPLSHWMRIRLTSSS